MNQEFALAMRRVKCAMRDQKLMEATRIIQEALSASDNRFSNEDTDESVHNQETKSNTGPFLDQDAEIIEPRGRDENEPELRNSNGIQTAGSQFEMCKVLRNMSPFVNSKSFGSNLPMSNLELPTARRIEPPLPNGAKFLARSYSCFAGERGYRLFIPSCETSRVRGLIVLLHGCRQSPEDFAMGTNMNSVAEINHVMVAYPGQGMSANVNSCWNRFDPIHQKRDAGEPKILAGITHEIVSEFGAIDLPVFVAGMSAGGAMAAVMGETYPDLYEAVGIHSGLAFGSAKDVKTALAAMRGQVDEKPQTIRAGSQRTAEQQRIIIFHGRADNIVHCSNAKRIFNAACAAISSSSIHTHYDISDGGRCFTRTIVENEDGKPNVEYWLLDNIGHAWSGGKTEGSYTDPKGPCASTEMVRFFLEEEKYETNT